MGQMYGKWNRAWGETSTGVRVWEQTQHRTQRQGWDIRTGMWGDGLGRGVGVGGTAWGLLALGLGLSMLNQSTEAQALESWLLLEMMTKGSVEVCGVSGGHYGQPRHPETSPPPPKLTSSFSSSPQYAYASVKVMR